MITDAPWYEPNMVKHEIHRFSTQPLRSKQHFYLIVEPSDIPVENTKNFAGAAFLTKLGIASTVLGYNCFGYIVLKISHGRYEDVSTVYP
jgi:hypothetical protein